MKLIINTNLKFELITTDEDVIIRTKGKNHYLPKNAKEIEFNNHRLLVNGKIYTDLSE